MNRSKYLMVLRQNLIWVLTIIASHINHIHLKTPAQEIKPRNYQNKSKQKKNPEDSNVQNHNNYLGWNTTANSSNKNTKQQKKSAASSPSRTKRSHFSSVQPLQKAISIYVLDQNSRIEEVEDEFLYIEGRERFVLLLLVECASKMHWLKCLREKLWYKAKRDRRRWYDETWRQEWWVGEGWENEKETERDKRGFCFFVAFGANQTNPRCLRYSLTLKNQP